jgi:hypothetical protein
MKLCDETRRIVFCLHHFVDKIGATLIRAWSRLVGRAFRRCSAC